MSRSFRNGLLIAAAVSLVAAMPIKDAAADDTRYSAKRQVSGSHHDSNRAWPGSRPRAHHYPPLGYQVRTLPRGYETVRVNRSHYHYYSGAFYRPWHDGLYVVVNAPYGARVRHLPSGYISFLIGPRRYFYVNYTYYLWERGIQEYVVVEEPAGAEAAVVSASDSAFAELFVYPNRGQDEEQRDRDRYECYRWAVEETDVDPGVERPDFSRAGDYRRALSACLEGRGYTVK